MKILSELEQINLVARYEQICELVPVILHDLA